MTKYRTKSSPYLYRILKCEKGKANAAKIIIQYPANVILKVLVCVSADSFTCEQAKVGK